MTSGGYLGLDLTSSAKKATACALLSRDGSLSYLGFQRTDDDILALVDETRPDVVAIDAPLTLPEGLCCLENDHSCEPASELKGRQCERDIRALGVSLYVTTKKSFIKGMIYRGIGLAIGIRTRGVGVVEIYPYASKVMLLGKPLPKKTRRAGNEFFRSKLAELIPGVDTHPERINHDLCDAMFGAYTAYLESQGKAWLIGDEREGRILVPSAP